jgi:hypothetical protein
MRQAGIQQSRLWKCSLAIVGLKKALIRMKTISHESWLAGAACSGKRSY